MFLYRHHGASFEVAFTDRHGGVSDGPWASLNLGSGNGDDPERVETNQSAVVRGFGADPQRVVRMSQVHGRHVAVAVGPRSPAPVADGLVATEVGVTLLVRAADCLSVVLADTTGSVVGVAHAGRAGVVGGVVESAVEAMRRHGAASLVGWLGPRVCGRCYEVPDGMRSEVATAVPATWSETSWGTPAVDVAAGVRAQLTELDVDVVDIADTLGPAASCTVENDDLFSYRRQGQRSGRLGGLVRLTGRSAA